jgi:hypothetical protein
MNIGVMTTPPRLVIADPTFVRVSPLSDVYTEPYSVPMYRKALGKVGPKPPPSTAEIAVREAIRKITRQGWQSAEPRFRYALDEKISDLDSQNSKARLLLEFGIKPTKELVEFLKNTVADHSDVVEWTEIDNIKLRGYLGGVMNDHGITPRRTG